MDDFDNIMKGNKDVDNGIVPSVVIYHPSCMSFEQLYYAPAKRADKGLLILTA